MAEKPIIFSTEMVQAISEGRKTQTRRVIKPQPKDIDFCWPDEKSHFEFYELVRETDYYISCGWCPYGRPGDTLWVRETWATFPEYDYLKPSELKPNSINIFYKANGATRNFNGQWRPSIFMPRWASRLTLQVENMRVERVKDIDNHESWREGIPDFGNWIENTGEARDEFARLWDSINARRGYGWQANPWVWVIEFSVFYFAKV